MSDKIDKSDEEWRRSLTPEQYRITRQAGTEPAFTGPHLEVKDAGTFECVCCGAPLFQTDVKYESGSGWPSFYKPLSPEAVQEHEDLSHGMRRVEVVCSKCDAHLGHVFPDGPQPTGLRYCINGHALNFKKGSD